MPESKTDMPSLLGKPWRLACSKPRRVSQVVAWHYVVYTSRLLSTLEDSYQGPWSQPRFPCMLESYHNAETPKKTPVQVFCTVGKKNRRLGPSRCRRHERNPTGYCCPRGVRYPPYVFVIHEAMVECSEDQGCIRLQPRARKIGSELGHRFDRVV